MGGANRPASPKPSGAARTPLTASSGPPPSTVAPEATQEKLPRGYISRAEYRARYGDDADVPSSSWGVGGIAGAMSPLELSRVRGKRGV